MAPAMKAASQTRSSRPARRRKPVKAVKRSASPPLASTKRAIEARLHKVEQDVARLRRELRTSHVSVTAASLRALNERQAHEGLSRLQADLRAMRDRGIIDEKGDRLHKGPVATPTDATSDV